MQIRLNVQWICWSRSCHRGKIPMEILSLKCKLIVTGNSNWSQLTFVVNLWIVFYHLSILLHRCILPLPRKVERPHNQTIEMNFSQFTKIYRIILFWWFMLIGTVQSIHFSDCYYSTESANQFKNSLQCICQESYFLAHKFNQRK